MAGKLELATTVSLFTSFDMHADIRARDSTMEIYLTRLPFSSALSTLSRSKNLLKFQAQPQQNTQSTRSPHPLFLSVRQCRAELAGPKSVNKCNQIQRTCPRHAAAARPSLRCSPRPSKGHVWMRSENVLMREKQCFDH